MFPILSNSVMKFFNMKRNFSFPLPKSSSVLWPSPKCSSGSDHVDNLKVQRKIADSSPHRRCLSTTFCSRLHSVVDNNFPRLWRPLDISSPEYQRDLFKSLLMSYFTIKQARAFLKDSSLVGSGVVLNF